MNPETEQLIEQAEQVYKENFSNECHFERAVFLSWYCSLGDCTFCYMSTQKSKIKDPKKARRRLSSVLAEIVLSKELGWKIEFLSAGYGSYTNEELLEVVKASSKVAEEKLWLNIGYLDNKELNNFLPYLEGTSASIETVNWELRKKVCPSKPLEPMFKMLKLAEEYNLKKGITIIIGLGEKIEDIEELFKLIKEYKLDRVTFYSLNPHEGTAFSKGPETEYYLQWVAKTRIEFPRLEIITGSWVNRLEEIHLLLKAGANAFTKFPALKLFGSNYAQEIEAQIIKANRKLKGSLIKLPEVDWEKEINSLEIDQGLKSQVYSKLKEYLNKMKTKGLQNER
jgi:biotin synthase-like enzyme